MENDLGTTNVLIFEDDETDAALLGDAITKLGYRVEIATNLTQMRQHIENPDFGIAFVNVHLDDDAGLDFIASVKDWDPHFVCVAMTGQADFDSAVQAMRAGASDFVAKPVQTEVLVQALERGKEIYHRGTHRERLQAALHGSSVDVPARETIGRRLQDHESTLLAAIQNAIPVSVALLDHDGDITFVNDAWRTFAREHGGDSEYQWVGQNYLKQSESDGKSNDDSSHVTAGIRTVLTGEEKSFKHTYLCKFSGSEYWFRMEVHRVPGRQALTTAVMHFDVTDMMKSRRDSEENERRLRSMVDNIIWGILTIDEKGTIEEVNPAVRDIFGYEDDELIGNNINMLMPEPDHSRHDGYLSNFTKTGEVKIIGTGREVVGRRKDGSLVPLHLGVSEVEIDGQRRFTGMVVDISEQKLAEEALRESETRLQDILDSSPFGITIISWNTDERLYANPRMAELMGAESVEHLLATPIAESFVDPADRPSHADLIHHAGSVGEFEIHRRRHDGSAWWCLMHIKVIDIRGEKVIVSWHHNIDGRKQSEEALRESETRLREILDSSPVGISITSRISDKRLYANPRIVEMMGAESAEHLLSSPVDESFANPAERPMHLGVADTEFAKGVEARRRRRDGSEWWCLMHGNIINFRGEEMLISWVHDIDERKQTEEYLMESEARLRSVLEGSPVGVTIVSRKQKKRMYVNQRVVDLFGADSKEQFLATDIAASYAVPEDYKKFHAPINPEQFISESENLRLRKDGSEWWSLTTRRLGRYRGEEALFVWTYDNTERRAMNLALKESENRFRDFASTASDWYWELDENLRYAFLSERYQEVTGADPLERLGKTLREAGIPGLSEEELQNRLNIYSNREPFRNHLHSRQLPDGSTVYLSLSGVPTFDFEGCFKGYRGTGADVSDLVLAEYRVRESEQRFQMLATASPAGVFYVDVEGVCQFVNEAFATIIGVPAEALQNTLWYRTVHHEDIGHFEDQWHATVSDAAAFRAELQFAHPDGNLVWAEINASPHCGADGNLLGYLGTAINIEDRKSVERELHEVEARATAVLDNAPAAIYVKDTAGRYLKMNNRFKEVFEVGDDALGKTDDELFSSKIAEVLKKNDSIVLTSKTPTEEEETIILKNGSRTFLTSRIPLYDIGDESYAVCAISTDITERKMTEAQLLHSSKMASIGSMSAGIAHELSQPLHIMSMIADNKIIEFEEGEADLSSFYKSLKTVSEQCRRMAQTIMHMSVFSRIDDVEHTLFAVRPALKQTISLLKKPFMAEGIALKINLPMDCGYALGHHSQFEQVIINLLTNARDAMKDSAVETANDIPEIKLSCTPNLENQTVEISIEDQGPGIPDRVMSRIFDPFYTTKEPGKGTGLGLAICMGIVNSMGGVMKAANTASGAQFTISLPLRNDDSISHEEPAVTPVSTTGSSSVTAGRRILIVDDEETAASTLSLHLRRIGYEVDTANDGFEALAQFIKEPADLVITDLRMPRMDGEELIGKLRAENTDLPIIIVTGDLDAGDRLKTLPGRGPIHLQRKPLILRNLYEQLEQLLSPVDVSDGERSK